MGETVVAEGFGPVKVGTILTCRQVRRMPLGVFMGSEVDMEQQVEELHGQLRDELEAAGIGTVRVFGLAQWLGIFDFEVEVHLEVVMFWPAKGRSVEEVQLAGFTIFQVILVLSVLLITAYIVDDVRGATDNIARTSTPFTVFGVALGLIALAFIVYQIQKSAPGGSHVAPS